MQFYATDSILHSGQLQDQTCDHSNHIQYCYNFYIFLLIRIHFEQYYKPDTGSRAKSRDHRGKRNCPAQIQLCQNHGRRTIWDQADQAAIAGWNTVSPSIIAEILSIPSMSIHRFKINVNTNRYKKIFPVWRSAGFTIPAE
mgnify:CR=1 FL=1